MRATQGGDGMDGKGMVLCGLAAAAALAGCGSSAQSSATTRVSSAAAGGSGTPSPAAPASAATSPGAGGSVDLALVESVPTGPPYSAAVTFYAPDGSHAPAIAVQVPSPQNIVVAAGAVWYVDGSNHLGRVRPDGSTSTVALLDPAPASFGLAVSPDGSRWVWSVVTGTTVLTSSVWTGGISTPPRQLVSTTSDPARGPVYVTRAWPKSGPVVMEQPVGIGGRILFDDAVGQADRLDVDSGKLTKLLEAECQFDDITADGTIACTDNQHPRTFVLVHPDGSRTTVEAPGKGEYGSARLDPRGRLLAIGYEVDDPNVAGFDGKVIMGCDIVDLETGQHTTVTRGGLTPAGWLPSGQLVAVDRFSSNTTSPAFRVDASGNATAIGNAGDVVAGGPVTAS